jgi:hypothetical protein
VNTTNNGTYVAQPTDSNINQLQNFSTTNTSWIGTMEIAALRAYQNAFAKYPISVVFATTHPQLSILQGGYVQVLDQGFAAYIVGSWPVPSSGLEFPGATGRLYYLSFIGDAQVALGHAEGQGPDCGQSWCDLLLAYPPTQQTTLAYAQLMTSIGTAMGNAATHETGHYLETVTPNGGSGFPYMDCGAGRNDGQPVVPCEGNNNFVYNFWSASGYPQTPNDPTSNGGQFFFLNVASQPTIHWGPSNVCWLQNYSAPGSCK